MFLMSTLTLQILAIVGIILGLILLTFLYILTMYLIAKKQNITVEKIYQQTRPFQAERLELIKHGFDILDEKNYSTNESLRELYLEIDELYKLDVKSKRGYVKQSIDILFIYLIKVFKEDLKADEEFIKKLEETNEISRTYFDKYNKKAMMFNSFKSMILVKPFLKKLEKKEIL